MIILHISPNFNYTCGVSKYLTIILSELVKYPELKIHFITNGGDSLERLESIGINPYIMKFDTGVKNVLYVRKNLKELESFCRLNKINIIHTHHRYPEFLANQLKHKLNVKTITTVHSLVRGFKWFSFRSDKIIAVSKAVEKNLIENYGVEQERIIQIYNPIDLKNEEANDTNELDYLKRFRVILFIGRNHPHKGLDLLLKAFEILSKKYLDIALVIVSDINEKQKNKIKLKNDRIFIFSPQKDVKKFYNIAEIVVLPSRVEPLGFVMLESAIYKKLFVGSNTGGISEFVENEISGLLSESGNLYSLVNVLDKAINLSLETKKEIVNNFYEKVLKLKLPPSYVEKLVEIYTQG